MGWNTVELGEIVEGGKDYGAMLEPAYKEARWTWKPDSSRCFFPSAAQINTLIRDFVRRLKDEEEVYDSDHIASAGLIVTRKDYRYYLSVNLRLWKSMRKTEA